MKTIVVGLGNPILSDDGVGPRIADELKKLPEKDNISVTEANTGGLGLLELLVGYDRAIIIDSIQTADGKAGHIHRLNLDSLKRSLHAGTVHDFNLFSTIKLGEKIGMVLPRQIDIYAIEVEDISTFSERCTDKVNKAIPICAEMILEELEKERN